MPAAYAWDVAVSGNYAYVADEDAGLHIIDITNPQNPVLAGICDTPGNALSVVVSGDHAYVADLSGGLRVIDVSNHQNPVEAGYDVTPDLAYGIAMSGNCVYMGDYASLRIVNVSNPASPTEVGFIGTTLAVQGVSIVGNLAYFGEGSAGFRVVDVSNPASPLEVGYYNLVSGPTKVAASGPYAYCACWGNGLGIFQYYGAGVEERPGSDQPRVTRGATIVRNVLILGAGHDGNRPGDFGSCPRPDLLDATGRKVLDLVPGTNDVSLLAPGIYFVSGSSAVTKVLVQK